MLVGAERAGAHPHVCDQRGRRDERVGHDAPVAERVCDLRRAVDLADQHRAGSQRVLGVGVGEPAQRGVDRPEWRGGWCTWWRRTWRVLSVVGERGYAPAPCARGARTGTRSKPWTRTAAANSPASATPRPVKPETAKRQATGRSAQQVAELVGRGAHGHDGDLVLGRGVHPEGARGHRAPAVDERHDGEQRERHHRGRAHGAEHEHSDALERRQRIEQGGGRAGGVPTRREGPGDHRRRGCAEAERDDGRRQVIARQQQRAAVGEHAGPRRVGEQLAAGETCDRGPAQGARGAARAPRRRVGRPQPYEHERDQRDERRDGDPGPAPVQAGDRSHRRHAHDPSGRHAGDRPREHMRPADGVRPLSRCGDADRDEQADADAEDGLRGGEDRKCWCRRTRRRSEGNERRPGGQQVAGARTPGRDRQKHGGQAAGRAGDRAQLSRGRRRDAELARDLGEDRREHEHCRLRREQAERTGRDSARQGGAGVAWPDIRRHARQRPVGVAVNVRRVAQ